ncbi:MAG: ElyC/SanA/YdcF family protein [Cyanobacteria bacterium P01_F01_bin.53]
MLVLLTRVLLWASIGLLLWYILARIIDRKYLSWFGGVILILLLVVSYLESDNDTVRILWQVLSFPLSPLGLVLVLIGGALSDGIKKVRGMPIAIAFGILLISSIPLFAQSLVTDAEQKVNQAFAQQSAFCGDVCRVDEVPGANLASAGAIAVFGDSRDADVPINGVRSSGEIAVNTVLAPRLIYAADLYRQARNSGSDPLVIVTAGQGNDDSPQRATILNILERSGVPTRSIQIQDTGLNIHRTAETVDKTLRDLDILPAPDKRGNNEQRVVVVAPAILMPRAALTFERMNLDVIARPTDFYSARFNSGGGTLDKLPDLLPSVGALQLTTQYWNELLNSMYYFLRGWLPDFNFGWNSSIEI